MENKVQQFGKFRYVEPNDFLEDRLFSDNNTSYNLTHSYEDYCISVDLIVSIPDRNEGVKYGENVYETTNDNNRRTTSFFGGKNFGSNENYLSDTPGSIVYRDILNGDIDGFKENLGITNINISYNSYFYPEITINFTDIRGGALMMPSEEDYRRNQINLEHKNKVEEVGLNYKPIYTKQVESFFSSLFSFPYPEFRLRVKGFYGKKIEFILVISDFRSSFNNQTGNFDATVKFIGKMYGMYTDIPMSYLLIAPYCKYGSKKNQTVWEEKNYKFNDGTIMPTFLGLREKIASSNVNLKNEFTIETVYAYQKSNNKKDLLLNIRNKYYELTSYLSKIDKKNDVYIDDKSEKIILLKKNFDDSRIVININSLIESIDRYNESFPNEKLLYPSPLKKVINKLTEIPSNEIYINSERSIHYFSWSEAGYVLNELNEQQKNVVKNYFNNYIKNNSTLIDKNDVNYYNLIYLNDFINNLNKFIENTTNEIKNLEGILTKEGNNNITKLLGFKPTIKNIFHMLMAHLSAFVELYSRFVANVTGVNNRTLNDIKISLDELPDIKKDTSNKKLLIPPFPAIKNIHTNQYCYQPSKVEMEETNFIASLFNSSFGLLEDIESSNKLIEQYYDENLKLIPTCLYDIGMYDSNKQINPYEDIFTKNDDIGLLFTYFGIRCIIKYAIEREETWENGNGMVHHITPDMFGKLEAYNFWRVNKHLKKEIFSKFNNTLFADSVFISYLKNEQNASDYYVNNKPAYYSNNVKSLVCASKNNTSLILPNTFNFPSYFDGLIDFLKNTNDTTKYISTSKEWSAYSRPYIFLKFIDKSNIENLQSQIESAPDLSKFCDNTDIILKDRINTKMERFKNTQRYRHNAILFRNKPSDGIYMKYKNFKSFEDYAQKSDFTDLQRAYESEFNNNLNLETLCFFTDVNGYKREFFFKEESKPEEFLSLISHDLFNISECLKYKGRIIDMPYATCLFIGMLMKKFKECKTPFEFKKFLNETVYSRLRELGELNDTHTNIEKYPESLSTIFKTLMRRDNGSYKFYSQESYEEMFINENKIHYSKDILGLIKMYEDWCNSNAEGGWLYFKDKYKLSYKLINEEDIINDLFEDLDDKFEEEDQYNKIETKLNEYFTRSGEKNAFTKRYSTIYRIDEGGQDTDYAIIGFNHEFEAYKSLNEFFKKSKKLLIPYRFQEKSAENDIQYHVKINDLKTAFNSFKGKLIELYGTVIEKNNLYEDGKSESLIYDVSEESKLSMYLTLKNLYDKHFCGLNKNKFDLKKKNCEFDRFYFIDTFYNDLSDKLVFNLDIMIEVLDILVGSYNNNVDSILSSEMSLFSFMSLLCEKHHMMLLSLPIFNGKNPENLEKMFTPLSYNSYDANECNSGPTYVCFYPHQPSQHLDNPSSQYSNDGFNIDNYDLNDTANFNGSSSIKDLMTDENGYIIPAFGVEYGSQKQSIFKNININMDDPQITEVSIRNQFALANKSSEDVRKLGFEGQDLFKIYSNYSYTCQVEMMGCAQIQPLMYFQLNNIPLFRGAYQIIKVEHNITPGNMSTTFKGVRISKTKIPLVDTCISINSIRNYLTKISTEELENRGDNYRDYILEPVKSNSNYQMVLDLEISSQKIKTDFPDNIIFESGQESKFNTLNPDLRKLIYSIVKDLNKMSTNEKKIGISISSSTREALVNNNGKSDHLVNSKEATKRRKELIDKNNNTYDKLGCAVDIIGTINGVKDKGETSITVFNLIATNYYNYIRQLIWEINTLDASQNIISNCIHLSSYGNYPTRNDTCQIFVSSSKTDPKFSGKTLGSKILPSAFLKIKENLQTMTDSIRFTNFPDDK